MVPKTSRHRAKRAVLGRPKPRHGASRSYADTVLELNKRCFQTELLRDVTNTPMDFVCEYSLAATAYDAGYA